jgi:putative thioredoxin
LIERLPESLQKDSDVSAVLAIIDTMERAANLDEIEALQQKVRSNPNDLQAYFDLALGLNAKDNRDEAAQALLEIIKKDRSWNDDGARKQLVQFFEAWGPMDKATISARRRLSGLLFS